MKKVILCTKEELQVYKCGDYKYTVNEDGTVTITGYSGNAETLTISETLDGRSVTAIDGNPFRYNDKCTKFNVSPKHPTLAVVDGVLFEKTTRTLIAYPRALSAREYTIPQGIRAIGDHAFDSCSGLTEVNIPDSVTSIGDAAFSKCEGLVNVIIPDSVTSIGNTAFLGCEGLTEVSIPDNVTTIGSNPFVYCNELRKIVVSPNNSAFATIYGALFDKSTKTFISYPCALSASNYTIPQDIRAIGDGAFAGCKGLTKVSIPDSVTSIGDFAFFLCEGLTEVSLPNGVTSIGQGAFSGCNGLTEVSIPDSVTSIGFMAFVSSNKDFVLAVGRDSYAEKYAEENGIAYKYTDLLDWLLD